MPRDVDAIMAFADLMEEQDFGESMRRIGVIDYPDYLAIHYANRTGQTFPALSGVPDITADAEVNAGRWLWRCRDCFGAVLLDRDTIASFCPDCGGGETWRRIIWPDDVPGIEAELLRQPGYRSHAPVRSWLPTWTMDRLRERTARAEALRAAGQDVIRKLSIGTTRTWATGETLTAAHMNLYISNLIDDLAGRDGAIELEDSLVLPAGQAKTLRFGGMTGVQRAATLSASGVMVYDTSRHAFYGGADGAWTRFAAVPGVVTIDSNNNNVGLALTDEGKTLVYSAAGASRTITLPDLSADDLGLVFTIVRDGGGNNTLTIDPHGADTIVGKTNFELVEDHESITITPIRVNDWAILNHYVPSDLRIKSGAPPDTGARDDTLYLDPEDG